MGKIIQFPTGDHSPESIERMVHDATSGPEFKAMFEKLAASMPDLFDGVSIEDLTEPGIELIKEKVRKAATRAKKAKRTSTQRLSVLVAQKTVLEAKERRIPSCSEKTEFAKIIAQAEALTDEICNLDYPLGVKEGLITKVDDLCLAAMEYWTARGCRYGYEAGLKTGRAEKGAA